MFRSSAKVKYAPYTRQDREKILNLITEVFNSYGIVTEKGLTNDKREPDPYITVSVRIPYKINVKNQDKISSKLNMTFEYPEVFFEGIMPIILESLKKRLSMEGLESEVGSIKKGPNAIERDPTSTSFSRNILFYIPLLEFQSRMPFQAPVAVSDAISRSLSKEFSNGFINPLPKRESLGRSPELLRIIKKNEDHRRAIGITPEIENIINSTRLEYGTCQICGRIMKMIVSGENTNRFLNEKGTIFRHNSIDVPGKQCPGSFRLPYELSRDDLIEYKNLYKAGKIVKPVNPIRLAKLGDMYAAWRFKDPTKTPWGVSKPKAKRRTVDDFLNSWQKKLEKLKTSPDVIPTPVKPPVVKRTPTVKTPAVKPKTPPVKRTPAVKLSVNETLFSNSLAYLNADFDLYNLQPQEAIYVISELKPITDKLPGSAKPAPSKGGLPLLWVNKLIAELKQLSSFYDLGDLDGEEVKMVMASLKPILDKMPVTFTNKKASFRDWV